MTEEESRSPKYRTVIEDWEHNTVLMALLFFKGTSEYLNNKDVQRSVSQIEEKINRSVREVQAFDKSKLEPEKYSDLTFEKFMDGIKDSPAPEGAIKLELNKHEQSFMKIMVENCIIASVVFNIEPEKMIDILNLIAKIFMKRIDERGGL